MKSGSFNEMVRWSNLARLASGNFAKLTVAAPFVAFIILHNEPLAPFIELSNNRHPMPAIEYLALARFDLFYLGLIIVVLGVGLFSIVSPKQITTADSYEAFIALKETTKTPSGIAGSLRQTLERFLADGRENPEDMAHPTGTARFPRRFRESLHSLMHTIVEDGQNPVDAVRSMARRDASDESTWSLLYKRLVPHSIDVYRLEYIEADYARPGARAAVFWLLGAGILVALVPTVITTALVLTDLVAVAEMSNEAAQPVPR